MPKNELEERALNFACAIHAGQTRQDGEPMILHVQRVAAQMSDPFDRVCALLHDTIEDGPDNCDTLIACLFGFEIFGTVNLLTRYPSIETYRDYIELLATDQHARRVKIADLLDNLDGCTPSLRVRYRKALAILGESTR